VLAIHLIDRRLILFYDIQVSVYQMHTTISTTPTSLQSYVRSMLVRQMSNDMASEALWIGFCKIWLPEVQEPSMAQRKYEINYAAIYIPRSKLITHNFKSIAHGRSFFVFDHCFGFAIPLARGLRSTSTFLSRLLVYIPRQHCERFMISISLPTCPSSASSISLSFFCAILLLFSSSRLFLLRKRSHFHQNLGGHDCGSASVLLPFSLALSPLDLRPLSKQPPTWPYLAP
jgi:hypothetical protein